MKHLALSFRHEYNDIRLAVVLNEERFLTFQENPYETMEIAENAAEFLDGVLQRYKKHSIADVINEMLELEKDGAELGRFAFMCGCHLTNGNDNYRRDVRKHLETIKDRQLSITEFVQEVYRGTKMVHKLKFPTNNNAKDFAVLSAIILLASVMTIVNDKEKLIMEMLEDEIDKRDLKTCDPKIDPNVKRLTSHFDLN